MGIRPKKPTKNPPILSHEFVIQNHADIVSCVAMVFIIGLMFQATSPVATLFVTMQHNVTLGGPEDADADVAEGAEPTHPSDLLYMYTYGLRDIFSVFFYCLIAIVLHAILQEYVLDKLNRRMHLSKVKQSKFNESGQLLAFFIASAAWGIDIIIRENLITSISSLWEAYPEDHANLPFTVKFYFITQIAYWFHSFPELYFQKVRKDEVKARIQYVIMFLVFVIGSYVLNFTRISLCLLITHYTVECIYHGSRLSYFADKKWANIGFKLWNVLFVAARLTSFTIAVLTFWHGLAKSTATEISVAKGNFNTFMVRIICLTALCLLQAWQMWRFITFHLRHNREQVQSIASSNEILAQHDAAILAAKAKKEKKNQEKAQDSATDNSPPGTPKNQQENGVVTKRAGKAKKSH